MNIFIYGVRTAIAEVNGAMKEFKDRRNFETWDTRTEVTYRILALDSTAAKVQAYKDWVLSLGIEDEQVPIYASYDDQINADLGMDVEPIGFETFNLGTSHIKQLDEFVQMCSDNGYEVKFEML